MECTSPRGRAPAPELALADFDYPLPPELVAQHPLPEPSASRLLHVQATRRDDLKLTLGLYYGYELTPGIDGLVSELAVGLMPDQTLTGDTAGIVAAALDAWQASVKPAASGGLWIVTLMLYSSLDPGKRVLLSIDRLSYSLA